MGLLWLALTTLWRVAKAVGVVKMEGTTVGIGFDLTTF